MKESDEKTIWQRIFSYRNLKALCPTLLILLLGALLMIQYQSISVNSMQTDLIEALQNQKELQQERNQIKDELSEMTSERNELEKELEEKEQTIESYKMADEIKTAYYSQDWQKVQTLSKTLNESVADKQLKEEITPMAKEADEQIAKIQAQKEQEEKERKEQEEKERQEQLAKEQAEKEEQERQAQLAKEQAEKEEQERQAQLAQQQAEQECLAQQQQQAQQAQNNTQTYTNTQPLAASFIINANTGKFHRPSCPSVKQMNPSNMVGSNASYEALVAQGYSPCKRCL